MPNWCNNELIINGDKTDLECFRAFAKGNGIVWDGEDELENAEGEKVRYDYELDFSKFVRPTKKELDKPYGSGEAYGYHWCVENWGTKWNSSDVEVYPSNNQTGEDEIEDELIYGFCTAWSPMSQQLFDAMQEAFPKLEFSYRFYEEGCCFVGKSEDGIINGWTAPDSDEMRRVVEIYKHNACEEDKIGDEDDLLSDIYCDFFDAWACDENLYFAGGHFYWKPFNDEEIVLKEGNH